MNPLNKRIFAQFASNRANLRVNSPAQENANPRIHASGVKTIYEVIYFRTPCRRASVAPIPPGGEGSRPSERSRR